MKAVTLFESLRDAKRCEVGIGEANRAAKGNVGEALIEASEVATIYDKIASKSVDVSLQVEIIAVCAEIISLKYKISTDSTLET